ncbi:MAG TPA: helix-turn-helix transcriptional regulator [Rubrivivax sp.]|nr:helix-turn-helix transcriptional regulator [Rubrivivax sp.]HPO19066.1 helix-turn-helix transcriptional regulator [Rubrivivax sp.]
MFTMLDTPARATSPASPPPPPPWNAAAAANRPAATGASTLARWYELMLDEIDYGVLLLDGGGQLLHLNHVARCELDGEHPLWLLGRQLCTREAADRERLHDALAAATQRGLRRLLLLGQGAHRVTVAVVPLAAPGQAGEVATQLSLGKRHMCGELGVHWYARSHGLTSTEARVLESLSEGLQPNEIASRHGVELSTIRSQIASIRLKTHCDSIGALVRRVAVLPPLVGALRRGGLPQAA